MSDGMFSGVVSYTVTRPQTAAEAGLPSTTNVSTGESVHILSSAGSGGSGETRQSWQSGGPTGSWSYTVTRPQTAAEAGLPEKDKTAVQQALTPTQQEYVKQYEKVVTPSATDPMGYYKAVAPVIPGGPALNVETLGLTGWGNVPEARERVIGGIISQQMTPQQVAALSPGGYVQTPSGRSYYGGSESVFPKTPSKETLETMDKAIGISQGISLNILKSGNWTGVPKLSETAEKAIGISQGIGLNLIKYGNFLGTTPKPAKSTERMTVLDTLLGTEVRRYRAGEETPYFSEMLPVGSQFATQKDYEAWQKGQTFLGQYETELGKVHAWTPLGDIPLGDILKINILGAGSAYSFLPVVGQIPGAITLGQMYAGKMKEQGVVPFLGSFGKETGERIIGASIPWTNIFPEVRAATGRGIEEVATHKEQIVIGGIVGGIVAGTFAIPALRAGAQARARALAEAEENPMVKLVYGTKVGETGGITFAKAEELGGIDIEKSMTLWAQKKGQGYEIITPGVLNKDVLARLMEEQKTAQVPITDIVKGDYITAFGKGKQLGLGIVDRYSMGVYTEKGGIMSSLLPDTGTFSLYAGEVPANIKGGGMAFDITANVKYPFKQQVFLDLLKPVGEPQLRGGLAGMLGFTEERGAVAANIPGEMSWSDIFRIEKASEFSKYYGAAAGTAEKVSVGMQSMFSSYNAPIAGGIIELPEINLKLQAPVITEKFINPEIPEGLITPAPGKVPLLSLYSEAGAGVFPATGAVDVSHTGLVGISKTVKGEFGGAVAQKMLGRISTQDWLLTSAQQLPSGAIIGGGATEAIIPRYILSPILVTGEELKMLPYTTPQTSETPISKGVISGLLTKVTLSPISGIGLGELPTTKTTGGLKIVGIEGVIPYHREWQVTPIKEIQGNLLGAAQIQNPLEKLIEKEYTISKEITGQLLHLQEFQNPLEGQVTKQDLIVRLTPGKPFEERVRPPELPPEFPRFSGGGTVNVFNVPKSKLWKTGKIKSGRGEENPLASILESQQTQSRFMGRSWQLPRSPATLRRWRVAAGMGFGKGFPTRESARGLPKVKFDIFKTSKKKRRR